MYQRVVGLEYSEITGWKSITIWPYFNLAQLEIVTTSSLTKIIHDKEHFVSTKSTKELLVWKHGEITIKTSLFCYFLKLGAMLNDHNFLTNRNNPWRRALLRIFSLLIFQEKVLKMKYLSSIKLKKDYFPH